MSRNRIEWTGAQYWTKSFNPYIGCRKCSEACENCYAEAIVRRFKMNNSIGFAPQRQESKTMIPNRGIVFCGNMTDLYGDWVAPGERQKWYSMMFSRKTDEGSNQPNKAVYLWLTKRSRTLSADIRNEVLGTSCVTMLHPDAWYGITAENQRRYDERICNLRSVPSIDGFNVWVSCEPLLGPINLHLADNRFVKWVVVGCESGQSRRYCGGEYLKWYENIVCQCREAGVPVFVKQLPVADSELKWKVGKDISEFPFGLQFRQVPFPV